jgi:hypothetical protein
MKNLNCDYCLGVQGICTECQACFYDHCKCDPCAHNKTQEEDCIFCLRGMAVRDAIDEVVHRAAEDLEYGGEA